MRTRRKTWWASYRKLPVTENPEHRYSAVVTTPRKAALGGLMTWAAKRRFPTLLLLTGALFVIDLLVPDIIPIADELLLGLATLILARWKDSRKQS